MSLDIDFSKLPALDQVPVGMIADALSLKKIAAQVARGTPQYEQYVEMCRLVGKDAGPREAYEADPNTHIAALTLGATNAVPEGALGKAEEVVKKALNQGITDVKEVVAQTLDAVGAPSDYSRLVRAV